MNNNINPSIFRTYDIRGVVPVDLNEEISELIGKALGTYSIRENLGKKIVVGEDNRPSSPSLSKAFIKGVLSTGCDVTYVGLSLTPIIHYLTCVRDFSFGVNVTASHNPKEYNGYRIDSSNATPFYGDDLQELYKIIQKGEFVKGNGTLIEEDLFPLYLEYLKKRFAFKKSTKIVIDCGNGSPSKFAPIIFEALGCNVVPMYCELDSSYPHGMPNPEDRLHMDNLAMHVVEGKADVGFAFDTDGDRFGLVDNTGNILDTDKILLMFSEEMLKDYPGSTVLFDVKCSGLVNNTVTHLGGVPKMLRTGHPFYVGEIKKGAILGAEFSGHVFFGGDHYGYDDGIFAACKAIEFFERGDKSFYDMFRKYPVRYHTGEITLNCSDTIKFQIIDDVINVAKLIEHVHNVITLDGVRVEVTKTGWFLIRASNTTPKISIRIEGIDNIEARSMIHTVHELLSKYDQIDLEPLEESVIYIT